MSNIVKSEPIPQEQILKLDEIAGQALAVSIQKGQGFAAAFAMADAMEDLMNSITPAMVDKFMRLQNTQLGFRTDKDPAKPKWDERLNREVAVEAYGRDVVKVCCVQALLQGVQLIGDHFNIIAGGCYITAAGYSYRLKKLEGFANFEPSYGRVQLNVDKTEAAVRCSAKWVYTGVEQSIGMDDKSPCIIAIKFNQKFGTNDAVLGKVKRKFLKRVYEQVTGCETFDGDASEPTIVPGPTIKTAESPTTPGVNTPTETQLDGNVGDRIKALLHRDSVKDDQVLVVLKGKGIADAKIVDLYQLSDAKLAQVETAWATISADAKKVKL